MPHTIRIIPNEKDQPAGKLADVELHFDAADPLLAGLQLQGFAVWERRTRTGRNVTFPSRAYTVNGERRSFCLLRPLQQQAENSLRDAILHAYQQYEQQAEQAEQTIEQVIPASK